MIFYTGVASVSSGCSVSFELSESSDFSLRSLSSVKFMSSSSKSEFCFRLFDFYYFAFVAAFTFLGIASSSDYDKLSSFLLIFISSESRNALSLFIRECLEMSYLVAVDSNPGVFKV